MYINPLTLAAVTTTTTTVVTLSSTSGGEGLATMSHKNDLLYVLYSSGGTADVGRHAVKAALDDPNFAGGTVRVLTKDPQKTLLEETNWNCACPEPHVFTESELDRLDLRTVDVTKDDLVPHLRLDEERAKNGGRIVGIVSALGNRQPFYGDRVGRKGTQNLVKAIRTINEEEEEGVNDHDDGEECKKQKIERIVAVTTMGCNEDWPPVEFHWVGNIMKWLFRTIDRPAYRDLCGAEDAIRKATHTTKKDRRETAKTETETTTTSPLLDYLIIRPVGLGEERPPKGEWFVQKKKYDDKVGVDMSKMDCARFAVSEVLRPTYHHDAVVVGSDWETFELN